MTTTELRDLIERDARSACTFGECVESIMLDFVRYLRQREPAPGAITDIHQRAMCYLLADELERSE